MYNYPLFYIHTASYKNPACHPQHIRQEQRLYFSQAVEIVNFKLEKFLYNNHKVEQLTDKSWLVHLVNSNDPVTINICFDLDEFKLRYSSYFYRLTRDSNKDKSLVFEDILFTDKVCLDLSILSNRGKLVSTKLLTTNATNPLTIEDELEEVKITSYLQLGDILYNCITTNTLISNINDPNSLKIIELVDCYYQPKQLLSLCDYYFLDPNVILSTKKLRYIITTEEDDYINILRAYQTVFKCKKVNYLHLQYAYIEYCNLFV